MADGILSQEEINALLGGVVEEPTGDGGRSSSGHALTPDEIDALGEIGNINMGTAATTLFALLNHKVMITTPHVELLTAQELIDSVAPDIVTVSVDYTVGLTGTNLLMLKESDVRIIADLMMGGVGLDNGEELNELHLSAISEAMNQMIGSSSTSMSQMFDKKIDISPPHAVQFESAKDKIEQLISGENMVVKVSFRMQILDDIIDSELMQILPMSFAKELVDNLMNSMSTMGDVSSPEPQLETNNAPQQQNLQQQPPYPPPQQMPYPPQQMPYPPQQMPYPPQQMPYPPQQQYLPGMPPSSVVFQPDMQIATPQFQNFNQIVVPTGAENIDILLDVALEVSVELGRTKKKIREILDFSEGSIIELDKLVGEPIDILVNGKFIASGEVVVIDENFGVRIKSIIKPENRI
ncbi:flagellar motor switch phosphatase FliY [Candidatus Epulonipiscium viviparus]|uniref:flagellar motor switch phosphatase FliY n=1 Tax=Candidatus Epulonipiscium viviparus TaxID=420336 RepID=UPI00016C0EE9|nr:flagellar motor switch phosphatase FliY [Candidatus Epulopiscium viviparus]